MLIVISIYDTEMSTSIFSLTYVFFSALNGKRENKCKIMFLAVRDFSYRQHFIPSPVTAISQEFKIVLYQEILS